MASRTYVPTLRLLTYAILKFVARYRTQIDKNLTPELRSLLDVLVNAAQALANALPDPVLGD